MSLSGDNSYTSNEPGLGVSLLADAQNSRHGCAPADKEAQGDVEGAVSKPESGVDSGLGRRCRTCSRSRSARRLVASRAALGCFAHWESCNADVHDFDGSRVLPTYTRESCAADVHYRTKTGTLNGSGRRVLLAY